MTIATPQNMRCPTCHEPLSAPHLPGEVFCPSGHYRGFRVPALAAPPTIFDAIRIELRRPIWVYLGLVALAAACVAISVLEGWSPQ